MFGRVSRSITTFAAVASLLLLACAIEEDLRIHADGSGTYRVRIAIPKELGEGFGDFRKEAEKNGFEIVQEGETGKERFIVVRKRFTDISSVNDSHTHFELAMTDTGFMRREYRLRASLKPVGFGSFKRRLTISMPGRVTSSGGGVIDGSQVRWEGSAGGSLEVVSSGFYLPLTRNQNVLLALVAVTGMLLLLTVRLRRRRSNPSIAQV